jgi:ferredoxin
MAELIKVTINGNVYEVEKGARLIDVCREQGHAVPSFCYYADLALQASCRMCLVRIEKMPKLQTSCTITCTDGMSVTTQSEEIEKAQRGMVEFLLANHPLDCPVCDRGGECELQEMVFDWGGLEERFQEKKNYYPEKFLSPIVANDPQRCILCKRCTRVCDEWMGEDAIEAGGRGANTVIGTFDGWLNCSQCGNCIEVCPTGTLLDATYRHQARPWELSQTITTCNFCSDGCQMSLGSRAGEVMRSVARDRYVNGINGEFLCIKGRFAHPFINHEERIKTPLIRYKKGGKLIPPHGMRPFVTRRRNCRRSGDAWRQFNRRRRQSAPDERSELCSAQVRARSSGHEQLHGDGCFFSRSLLQKSGRAARHSQRDSPRQNYRPDRRRTGRVAAAHGTTDQAGRQERRRETRHLQQRADSPQATGRAVHSHQCGRGRCGGAGSRNGRSRHGGA